MYEDLVLAIINKAIYDEMTAVISYKIMSENVTIPELQEELKEHATEEYQHFCLIVSYAANHGLLEKIFVDTDKELLNNLPTNTQQIIDLTQRLEMAAINDYTDAVMLARQNNDVETEQFFLQLLKEEQEHFDELVIYTQKHRELNPQE